MKGQWHKLARARRGGKALLKTPHKIELQSICSVALDIVVVRPSAEFSRWLSTVRLQLPAHGSAGDIRKLLDEFERELDRFSHIRTPPLPFLSRRPKTSAPIVPNATVPSTEQ